MLSERDAPGGVNSETRSFGPPFNSFLGGDLGLGSGLRSKAGDEGGVGARGSAWAVGVQGAGTG